MSETQQPEAGQELDAQVEEALFGAIGRNEPRPFSTDLHYGAILLNKIHENGFFWRLDSVPNGVICTVQKALGDPRDEKTKRQTYQIGAATISLAISLAALKTV